MLIGWTSIPYDPNRPVAYMHVPKAAGTSTTRMLALALKIPRSRFQFDRYHFGRIKRPELIAPDCRARVCFDPSELLTEKNFLAGHFSLSTLIEGCPTAQYISTFREPVSRILSSWLFNRRVTDEQIEPWGDEWAAIMHQARGTLMDFLAPPTGGPQSDNMTVRMMLRPHPLIPEAGFIDPKDDEVLMAEAIAQLGRFSHVDIVSGLDLAETTASNPNVATWLGAPIADERLNEAPEMPLLTKAEILAQLRDSVVELLESRSRLDKQLWNYVAAKCMLKMDSGDDTRRTVMKYVVADRSLGAETQENSVM
jgi:hypothetical protein